MKNLKILRNVWSIALLLHGQLQNYQPRLKPFGNWKRWPTRSASQEPIKNGKNCLIYYRIHGMFDAHGHRRKLIIFTEHRDTMNYLTEKIRALIGEPETVINIHGSMGREKRKSA